MKHRVKSATSIALIAAMLTTSVFSGGGAVFAESEDLVQMETAVEENNVVEDSALAPEIMVTDDGISVSDVSDSIEIETVEAKTGATVSIQEEDISVDNSRLLEVTAFNKSDADSKLRLYFWDGELPEEKENWNFSDPNMDVFLVSDSEKLTGELTVNNTVQDVDLHFVQDRMGDDVKARYLLADLPAGSSLSFTVRVDADTACNVSAITSVDDVLFEGVSLSWATEDIVIESELETESETIMIEPENHDIVMEDSIVIERGQTETGSAEESGISVEGETNEIESEASVEIGADAMISETETSADENIETEVSAVGMETVSGEEATTEIAVDDVQDAASEAVVDEPGQETAEITSETDETVGIDVIEAETTAFDSESESEFEGETEVVVLEEMVDETEAFEPVTETEDGIEVETGAEEHFLETADGIEELNVSDFASMRLVVLVSDASAIIDPEHVIANYDTIYLMQYGSVEQAMNAYVYYLANADAVEPDMVLEAAEESVEEPVEESVEKEMVEINAPIPGEDIEIEVTEDQNPIAALSEEGDSAVAQNADRVIALIDTGASEHANVIDRVSLIDDVLEGSNSHANDMVSAIVSQNPDAKILSIRAMGDDGRGTVSSIVAAMEYAINQNVSIINLSLYAKNSLANSVLKSEIQKAAELGILVVGAAGNAGADAADYMPGSVEEAWIIGACNEEGVRLQSSNYGDTVDYNVVARSTSEATAKFSGYVSLYGIDGVGAALNGGLIYSTDFSDGIAIEDGTPFIKIQYDFLPYYDLESEDVMAVGQAMQKSFAFKHEDGFYYFCGNPYPDILDIDELTPHVVVISPGTPENVFITDDTQYDAATGVLKIPEAYFSFGEDILMGIEVSSASVIYRELVPDDMKVQDTPDEFRVAEGGAILNPNYSSYVDGTKWTNTTTTKDASIANVKVGDIIQIEACLPTQYTADNRDDQWYTEITKAVDADGESAGWLLGKFGFQCISAKTPVATSYNTIPYSKGTGEWYKRSHAEVLSVTSTGSDGSISVKCWIGLDIHDNQDQGAYLVVNYKPEGWLIKMTLNKTSAAPDSILKYSDFYSLKGAVYTLYTSESCNEGSEIGTLVTKEDGSAPTFSYLVPLSTSRITIWCKETKASPGHDLDPTKYSLTFDRSTYNSKQVKSFHGGTLEPEPTKYAHIRVKKTDRSGSWSDTLKGTQFTLYKVSSSGALTKIETITIQNDGYHQFKHDCFIGNTYLIRETKAVGGREPADDITVVVRSGINYKPLYSYTIPNDDGPVPVKVKIQKTSDSDDNEEGKKYNVLTLHSYSLEDAEFGIYSNAACTRKLGTLTTDAKGNTATFGLPCTENGTYTYWIREDKAPDGHERDTTIKTVTVNLPADDGKTKTVSFKDKWIDSSIQIKKTDASGRWSDDLIGAVFGLYFGDTLLSTLTITGPDYHEFSYRCRRGRTYTVKEITPPKGKTASEPFDVTIGDDIDCGPAKEVYQYSVKNYDEPSHIQIKKTDANGEWSEKLLGAVFTLYSGSNELESVTIRGSGYHAFQYDCKQGETYVIKETKTPPNKRRAEDITVKIGSGTDYQDVYRYDIPNADAFSHIEIKKVDGTGSWSDDLRGAEFTLYEGSASLETITINSSAYHAFKYDCLVDHTYVIRETKTPAGKTTAADVTVKIGGEANYQETYQYTIENKEAPKVAVKKISTANDEILNLSSYSKEGAEFGIYTDQACTAANKIGTLTTKADGTTDPLILPCQAAGTYTYWVREDKAPAGHKQNTTPKAFSVTLPNDDGRTISVEISDDPEFCEHEFNVIKIDDKGQPVPNAIFKVEYFDAQLADPSKLVKTWYLRSDNKGGYVKLDYDHLDPNRKSDTFFTWNGEIVIPIGGYLRLTEVEAPAEYILDDTPMGFLTTKTVELELKCVNTLEPCELRLKKYDINGTTPLPGVEFKLTFVSETEEYTADARPTYTRLLKVGESTTVKTDSKGEITFSNLDQGTYQITEVSTVSGHTLLKDPIVVTLPIKLSQSEIAAYGNVDTSKGKVDPVTGKTFFYNCLYEITNTPTFKPPMTGSTGTWKYGFIGIAMIAVLGAGVTVYTGRRRKRKTKA